MRPNSTVFNCYPSVFQRFVGRGTWSRVRLLTFTILLSSPLAAQNEMGPFDVPLRYLAINTGNADLGCWETKLCRQQDVQNLQDYIRTWQPDVVLLSEITRESQLTGTDVFGPILPEGYDGRCGESVDRATGLAASWDAPNASHEHDCVAWKTARLSYIEGSAKSAYGRNDTWGQSNCRYDTTGFRVKLLLDGRSVITAVSVHPDARLADCRAEEIPRYWSDLVEDADAVIIGGDWNTDSLAEVQPPPDFRVNYSLGQHWDVADHEDEFTAHYLRGLLKRRLDHTFSNFGLPCTNCGSFYSSDDLIYGSALGGYDDHPRADGGDGMDHRQILVDMKLPAVDLIFVIDTTGSMGDDIAQVKAAASRIVEAVAARGPSFRVAVVDYRDFPVAPYGNTGDYPYRAVLPFSTNVTQIQNALLSLSVGGGGDWPESVYSALVRGILTENLSPWRDNVKKTVLVIGDAPPHEPEPFTGYTDAIVVETAFSVDPAVIYGVVIGEDPDAQRVFSVLAEETGGATFTALTADDVVAAILEAIGDIDEGGEVNQPPACGDAQPSPSRLWPPNHSMRAVQIQNLSDPDGDAVVVNITGITQDEPLNGNRPDGGGLGTERAWVRAERSGKGNGRVYQIKFVASDGLGGSCSGTVRVCVPHDQGSKSSCRDDGQIYNSLGR